MKENKIKLEAGRWYDLQLQCTVLVNWQTKKKHQKSESKIPVTNQLTLEGVLTLVKLVSELAVAGSTPSSSNPNEANSYIDELLVFICIQKRNVL